MCHRPACPLCSPGVPGHPTHHDWHGYPPDAPRGTCVRSRSPELARSLLQGFAPGRVNGCNRVWRWPGSHRAHAQPLWLLPLRMQREPPPRRASAKQRSPCTLPKVHEIEESLGHVFWRYTHALWHRPGEARPPKYVGLAPGSLPPSP